MDRRRITNGILALNASLSQVVADMYLPAMPVIALALGISNDQVQYSVTAFLLGVATSQIVGGTLSDWLGRRRLNLIGFLSMLIGIFMCIHMHDVWTLCLGRAVSGIGAGMVTTLFYASARDQCAEQSLVKLGSYAAFMRVFILAWVPLLGSFWLRHFGWEAIFYFLFAYTGLFFILNLYFVPETRTTTPPSADMKQRLSHPSIWGSALISASLYGAVIAWVALAPILLQHHLGWTPEAYARTYLFTGGAFMLSTWCNARLASRFVDRQVLQCCFWLTLCLIGIMFVWLDHLTGWALVAIAMLLLAMGGWVFPRMVALALAPFPEFSGSVSAFYLTVRALGGVLTSAWIAHFDDQQCTSFAWILLICLVIAFFAYHKLILDPQD